MFYCRFQFCGIKLHREVFVIDIFNFYFFFPNIQTEFKGSSQVWSGYMTPILEDDHMHIFFYVGLQWIINAIKFDDDKISLWKIQYIWF